MLEVAFIRLRSLLYECFGQKKKEVSGCRTSFSEVLAFFFGCLRVLKDVETLFSAFDAIEEKLPRP